MRDEGRDELQESLGTLLDRALSADHKPRRDFGTIAVKVVTGIGAAFRGYMQLFYFACFLGAMYLLFMDIFFPPPP